MSQNNTNQTLIIRLKNKYDDSSWQEFDQNYKAYIRAVIRNLGVPSESVEDASQKTMLIIWDKIPSFNYEPNKCKFRTWMCRIIRNVANQYFSKQKRINNDVVRAQSQNLIDGKDEPLDPEIYKISEEEWKNHITTLALENLKQEFGGKVIDCFLMFMEGKDIESICTSLDIKKNSAYVYRKRVQERLFKEIRKINYDLS